MISVCIRLLLSVLLITPFVTCDQDEIRTASNGVRFVRTPESRFDVVTDFPTTTRYVMVSGLRMAYTDAGYATHGTILLLHGEPDWAYLYRSMIPTLARGGYRVIAPDYIGFGRSDKPVNRSVYTYDSHVSWMKQFLQVIDVDGMHAFLQDWGGLIGLTLAAEHPSLFDRLVLANTVLPDGTGIPNFEVWRVQSQIIDPFDSGLIIQDFTTRNLTDAEIAAYNAPFPSELYLAGARQFPLIVPLTPTDVGIPRFLQVRETLKSWTRPVLLQWGTADPILNKRFFDDFRQLIPGTDGQPHALYPEVNHFIQDEAGAYVADAMVRWLAETSDTDVCV
ncbi:haloalkane dehalogenase [Gracilaria domingensis]|nr:haloalkane dehalogenase [Gracilaria domingensis]